MLVLAYFSSLSVPSTERSLASGPFRFGDNGHSCHVDRAVPLTLNIIGLRLWKATLPTRSFDFYQLLPISHRPVALPAFVWLATGYKIEDIDWVSRNTTIIHKPNNRLDHSCEPKRLFWPISAHYLSRVRNAHGTWDRYPLGTCLLPTSSVCMFFNKIPSIGNIA